MAPDFIPYDDVEKVDMDTYLKRKVAQLQTTNYTVLSSTQKARVNSQAKSETLKQIKDSYEKTNDIEDFLDEVVQKYPDLADEAKSAKEKISATKEKLALTQALADRANSELASDELGLQTALKATEQAVELVEIKNSPAESVFSNLSDYTSSLSTQKAQTLTQKLPSDPSTLSKQNQELLASNQTTKKLQSAAKNASDETAKKAYKEALDKFQKVRVELISKDLAPRQSAIAKALASNASAMGLDSASSDILSSASQDELKQSINKIDKSLQNIASQRAGREAIEIIRLGTELQTRSRLIALQTSDIKLANAINSLSNEALASGELSPVMGSYLGEIGRSSGLWANVFGAKARVKDSANPSVFGLSLGYDHSFDVALLGGFVSFANTRANDETISNKSKIYQLGAYGRFFLGDGELDFKALAGTGKNDIKTTINVPNKQLVQEGKYNSKIFNLQAEYGYVFDLANGYFIKPLAGLEYSHIKNSEFKLKGDLASTISSASQSLLLAKLGAEFRAYYNSDSYAYILPAVLFELHKKSSTTWAKIEGDDKVIPYENKKEPKRVSFDTKLGVNLKLNQNLSFDVSLGTRLNSTSQMISANVGIKYKF